MGTTTWADVMANPYLKDLPFKIELNKWGRIEMSPVGNARGLLRCEIARELARRPGGRPMLGCVIDTTDGVRVADVAWISDERLQAFGDATPYPGAPEICVDVQSPSDSSAEMLARAASYVEAGAREVWVAPLDGDRRVIRA